MCTHISFSFSKVVLIPCITPYNGACTDAASRSSRALSSCLCKRERSRDTVIHWGGGGGWVSRDIKNDSKESCGGRSSAVQGNTHIHISAYHENALYCMIWSICRSCSFLLFLKVVESQSGMGHQDREQSLYIHKRMCMHQVLTASIVVVIVLATAFAWPLLFWACLAPVFASWVF